MRKVRFALLLLTAVAIAAGPASAAAPRVKKYYVPPARAAGLKPVIPAPSAPATTAGAPTLASRLTSTPGMSRPLTQSALQRGLTGLPAVGDPRPQCRTACAQTRFQCLSTDGDLCDQQWATCAAGCGS